MNELPLHEFLILQFLDLLSVTTPADTTFVAPEIASSQQSPNAEKGSEKPVLSESAQDKANSGDAVSRLKEDILLESETYQIT